MNGTTLVTGIFAGAIGMAYLVYGKKTSNLWFISAGILMLAYPYFFTSRAELVIIGILLLISPFVAERIS